MEDVKKALHDLREYYNKVSENCIGYPNNNNIEHSNLLCQFLDIHSNNVGDPFVERPHVLANSFPMEKDVLYFFADLYKIPREVFWGYTTSGGTEGNMHGLYLGRDRFPKSVLYLSEDSHYSIIKIAHILNMPYEVVDSHPDGTIDLDDLKVKMAHHMDSAVVINANVGTTMKGAIDDVDGIIALLKEMKVKDFHIHCDMALFGMILPFVKDAPQINFTKEIGSLAISGHKFIGSALPCGIALTRKEYVDHIANKIEYINSIDTTILGSRNAITPLVFWLAIQTRGPDGFQHEAYAILNRASFLFHMLKDIEYPAYLNKFSNTVFFKKPPDEIVSKYCLAVQGDFAHCVVMQGVTEKVLENFVNDLIFATK